MTYNNLNSTFVFCTYYYKAANQHKLCSGSTMNLLHICSYYGHQAERAALLYNLLPLVVGSVCLDATDILFTHMLMAKASHKPSFAKVYSSYGVGRKMIAMNSITIYHRTIQAGDLWIIIKFSPAGCNFRHQYFQLKRHWDMALPCLHIIKKSIDKINRSTFKEVVL